jgi:hypothetical protein
VLLLGVVAASAWLAGRAGYPEGLALPRDPLELMERESILTHPRFFARLIRTAPADYRYNCHDWTFSQGQRDVSHVEAEQLLSSDAFRIVDRPQVGDFIIYRSATGAIMHSGVVRATGADGLVLIESKWGPFGRYLHEPELPRNTTQMTYYRRTTAPPADPWDSSTGADTLLTTE